jgi:hypothetical protein
VSSPAPTGSAATSASCDPSTMTPRRSRNNITDAYQDAGRTAEAIAHPVHTAGAEYWSWRAESLASAVTRGRSPTASRIGGERQDASPRDSSLPAHPNGDLR